MITSTKTLLGHDLPRHWRKMGTFGPDGYAYTKLLVSLHVIETRANCEGKEWLHVSVSYPDKLPTYDDLCEVKKTFIGDERTALQIFPPKVKHVNIHNYCLHLFCCLDGDVTPDFTRGMGML